MEFCEPSSAVGNPAKAKGDAFERDVWHYLRERFARMARRPHQEGFKDVGDLHLSPFILQAKNYADTTSALNIGVRDAELQAVHAEETYGVAVIKKRGASVAEARVAMTLRTFRDVVDRLLRAESLLERYAFDAYELHAAALTDKDKHQ